MKSYTFSAAFVAVIVTSFSISCTNDVLPESLFAAECNALAVTYEDTVADIVDKSCAYSGCHASGGIGVGIFTSYSGLLPVLTNGKFEDRVFAMRTNPVTGMPPNASVYPESKKDDLTEEELMLLQCWLLAGFPEK